MAYFKYFRKENYLFDFNVTKVVTNISKYTGIFNEMLNDDPTFYTYYTMNNSDRLDSISEQLYGTSNFYWTIPLINANIICTWIDLPKTTPQLRDFLSRKYPGQALFIEGIESLIPNEEIFLETNPEIVCKVTDFFPTLGYITTDKSVFDISTGNSFNIVGAESGEIVQVNSVVYLYDAPVLYKNIDTNEYGIRSEGSNIIPITYRQIEDYENDQKTQIRVIRPRVIYEIADKFEKEMKRVGSRL